MTTPQMSGPNHLWDKIVKGAQSGTFNSDPLDITRFGRYALQVNITSQSSLASTIVVQATLDSVNWSTVPGSSVAFSTNTSYVWDNFGSGVVAVRLQGVVTGGSAIFDMFGFAKV